MLDEIGLHDSVSSNDVYRDCAPVVGQLDWAVRLVEPPQVWCRFLLS